MGLAGRMAQHGAAARRRAPPRAAARRRAPPVRSGPLHAVRVTRQATDAATHRWTVYVRGINNEDLSHLISKVGLRRGTARARERLHDGERRRRRAEGARGTPPGLPFLTAVRAPSAPGPRPPSPAPRSCSTCTRPSTTRSAPSARRRLS
jgi:hypothetical protein